MTKNQKIKQLMTNNRLYCYEVAHALGIREETFSKWFRQELTNEQEQGILSAISKLKGGKECRAI